MNFLFLLAACLIWPGLVADKPANPEQHEAFRIQQLKHKVEHDSDKDVCIDSADLVHELVEQFNAQITAGELQPAQQTLNDIGTFAEKARDGAKKSHHKLKQAELTLHKSSRRLADIAQALSVENRQAIDDVVKKIEAADDEILNQVFKN